MTIGEYVCTCDTPQGHTRPSGTIICLKCGLPIVMKTKPEERP